MCGWPEILSFHKSAILFMYGYYAFMLKAKAKCEILSTMWYCNCTTLNTNNDEKNVIR